MWSNYPILPWLELVVFGILFGKWILKDQKQAYSGAFKIGLGFLLAFVVIRYLDGFGNILPRMGNTWIDFLNLVKYPPSITFTLLTMGINLVLLGLFSRANEKVQTILFSAGCIWARPTLFLCDPLILVCRVGTLVGTRRNQLAGDVSLLAAWFAASLPGVLLVWTAETAPIGKQGLALFLGRKVIFYMSSRLRIVCFGVIFSLTLIGCKPASEQPLSKLEKLITDVFHPLSGEVVLVMIDLPHDHLADNEIWESRREMAVEWHTAFQQLGDRSGFEVLPVLSYLATGNHNAQLPEFGEMDGEQVRFVDLLRHANIVVAMTEYSATAPLVEYSGNLPDFRAASMPTVHEG